MRRGCFAASVLAVLALAGLALISGPDRLTMDELTIRCARSQPSWSDYQEDIKGQVGATPVARWRGHLVRVERHPGGVQAVFRVTGPWAAYDAAIPVLMKDPAGAVGRDAAFTQTVTGDGTEVRYRFDTRASMPSETLPWVEFRYPHRQQRVAFSSDGVWRSTAVAN